MKFIIDANLPFNVPAWNDDEIWDYAAERGLTIVTKDKDFLLKQTMAGPPPKVVHIKFGNLRLKEFVARIEAVWQDVERLLQTNGTVNIYLTKIEAIN